MWKIIPYNNTPAMVNFAKENIVGRGFSPSKTSKTLMVSSNLSNLSTADHSSFQWDRISKSDKWK